MKKTLQECKEIVAEQAGCQDWATVKELEMGVEDLADLANKMYYEQSEWIRVEDRLPELGVPVLVFMSYNKIDVCKQDGEGNWRQDVREEHTNGSVTHWMPLPSPPKQ